MDALNTDPTRPLYHGLTNPREVQTKLVETSNDSIKPKDGKHCVFCGQPFTNENVYTQLGWKETTISGSCEKCFDALFTDEVDDNDLGGK